MTREERNIKLKHLITCMKCEVSGKVCDDNCPTQYDAGNTGEIIENLEAISKILEQEPCEDCISRDSAIKAMDYDIKSFEFKSGVSRYMDDIAKLLNTIYEIQVNNIKSLPSVTPPQRTGHCKDCKFFEYDHVSRYGASQVPFISAHEICTRWGNGCQSNENGYCFLFEQKEVDK